jgi:hypothetical protein
MAVAYLSCFDYALSPSGLEYNSLIANMTRVASPGVIAGATSLPLIAGLTVALNPYDRLSIFDGAFSETVVIASTAILGATSVTCSPLQYPHAVGVPVCGDGVMGSLANAILTASTYLENICQQSLFQTTYTNELLAMPTIRASMDNQNTLHFRPRHWPINSLSAIAIESMPNLSITYDPTQVVIDSDKQICTMPNLQPLVSSGQAPYPIWGTGMSRNQWSQLSITYMSGFAVLPFDVIEAAILLTSDILAKRLNPQGAPDLGSGSRHISAVLRGDNSGESLLYKRARALLNPYSMESF